MPVRMKLLAGINFHPRNHPTSEDREWLLWKDLNLDDVSVNPHYREVGKAKKKVDVQK